MSVARTAAVVEHHISEMLKPFGVTPTQYNTLRILRSAGSAGLCRNAVKERLVSLVPDVTRLLDRLEEMNLVVREQSTEDRRYVTTRITQSGLQLLAKLDDPIQEGLRTCLEHMSKTDLRNLVRLLDLVRSRPLTPGNTRPG